jgi:uncharacterized protein DUF6766
MSVSYRTRPAQKPKAKRGSGAAAEHGLRKVWRENSLSIVMFSLFFLFLVGQSIAGWFEHNQEAREHGQAVLKYLPYLFSGHFLEAMFENWESEFLQMAAYVALTSFLFQKGSAESKKLPEEGENPQDEDPNKKRDRANAPEPVKRGGPVLWWYERSLSIVLTLFFLLSLAGHAVAGAREYSEEQVAHGEQAVSTLQYLATSRFWFESLQNWQSEFLAVFALVVLSIWLRDRGSPESKPVAAPHSQTGTD